MCVRLWRRERRGVGAITAVGGVVLSAAMHVSTCTWWPSRTSKGLHMHIAVCAWLCTPNTLPGVHPQRLGTHTCMYAYAPLRSALTVNTLRLLLRHWHSSKPQARIRDATAGALYTGNVCAMYQWGVTGREGGARQPAWKGRGAALHAAGEELPTCCQRPCAVAPQWRGTSLNLTGFINMAIWHVHEGVLTCQASSIGVTPRRVPWASPTCARCKQTFGLDSKWHAALLSCG